MDDVGWVWGVREFLCARVASRVRRGRVVGCARGAMSYKDIALEAPLEVRTRKSIDRDNTNRVKRSEAVGTIAQYWDDDQDWREKHHPNAIVDFKEFARRVEGKLLTVFLDYDGTLAPIVPEPDKAFMSDEMREAVRLCAQRFPVAIISGRSRHKVSQFIGLDELYYAGSHGLDIAGPKVTIDGRPVESKLRHQPAQWALDVMDRVAADLEVKFKDIPGTNIEHNTFCVSAHYRAVSEELRPRVEAIVDEMCASEECLIKHDGKMVWEVRPRVAWDKGKALSYLRQALLPELAEKGFKSEDVFTIYIGDDVTDEDAFMEINEELGDALGAGFLVASAPKVTAAQFSLHDCSEVLKFLTLVGELAVSGDIKTL